MTEHKPFSILEYIPAMKTRHSEYALSDDLQAPLEEVRRLLEDILLYTPSGFNSQPVRMVLLTGERSIAHWELVGQILMLKIGIERYEKSRAKDRIDNLFTKAVGTVLFFDDTEVTDRMMKENPRYGLNFPKWAHQAQGSHQFMVWLGLKALGYGANLQHYNNMKDDLIRKQVGVPDSWDFVAHMPFGTITEPAQPKEKNPIDTMLKVL